MSLVNLLGHLMCPDYSHMYLVDSQGLAALRQELDPGESFTVHGTDVFVDGVVGRISAESEPRSESTFARILRRSLITIVLFSPFIVIGALTGFRKGSSSIAQRAWTMSWLVFGTTTGIFVEVWVTPKYGSKRAMYFLMVCFLAIWGTPAVGGFVVVG